VVLRVYAAALSPPSAPFGPTGFFAPSCLPDHEVLVDVSSATVAGSVPIYRRSAQHDPPQGTYVGQAEGSSIALVAAQVPAGTRRAIMHFTGGATDEAPPVAGDTVVLAASVKPPPVVRRPVPLLNEPTPTLGVLSVVDASGHTQGLGAVRAGLGYPVPSSCLPRPPGVSGSTGSVQGLAPAAPTLPQATGAPPTDAAAARQAIETAYRKVFESKANRSNNRYLEGAPVLTAAQLRELQAGYGDITGKLKVRINDFRFLNRTQAALSFDLLLNAQPITATTVGQAVLINGQWKVARVTFCAVMSRANITCG
jgi:hypothetical protein